MRARVLTRVLVLLCGVCSSCSNERAGPEGLRLPDGNAGTVLARAIDAAGGWERWRDIRDVSFVTTLTILDPYRNVSTENIGWYMAPLHDGMRARMQSIGLTTEVLFGVNDADTWILRDGEQLEDPGRLALTRFDLVSNLFWFSLPFALAELPGTVTDLGEAREEDIVWQRLKVEFDGRNPGVPGKWFVLYFNDETGLIDHVHAHLSAPFLRHELWVGKWLDYRDWGGLKKERQRQFFPADADGAIIGGLVAEQLVEHVRFNTGFSREFFDKPDTTHEGDLVRGTPPARRWPARAVLPCWLSDSAEPGGC